jgi:NADH:ubiquinone oxidoreductase subunit 5 (subunit L)/multisubunit Na+/H+ antiporter MnhA subunit
VYDALLVRPLVWLSDRVFYRTMDAGFVDGVMVNGSAKAVQSIASRGLKHVQSGLTQSYLFLMVAGTLAIVGWLVS